MNIYELISRAQGLRQETKLDSVSPDRVGALCEDTLKYINEFQLLASSPSLHKIYASVSAMQADAAPKSDLTGKALKPGQLVVIVPASQSDATAGDVYRYDGPSGNTSAWTFISKIGGVPADAELNATSTNPVQNKAVTEKLTKLSEKYFPKMSVGFADDLSGHGESTPEEFTFRASGGRSIKDGTARIKTLRGNSVVVDGEILHSHIEAIKSVGDNAWNEQWEIGGISESNGTEYDIGYSMRSSYVRILPNTEYYFKKPQGILAYLYFYNENKEFVGRLDPFATLGEGGIFTTLNASYLRFSCLQTTYNNDIMISLVHSGWKVDTDAGYQPYWDDIMQIDSRIKEAFPDGMQKWDKAFNKNGKGYIVKGTGMVNLGSLQWAYDARYNNPQFYAEVPNKAVNDNVLCAKYTTYVNGGWDTNENKTIVCSTTDTNVIIVDSAYTDVASFKSAMQGTMLYYELAEPTIIEFDQPFNFDYRVADFGTEEALSSQPSASFRADIIYQFNAVDQIRENYAEIEKIKAALVKAGFSLDW